MTSRIGGSEPGVRRMADADVVVIGAGLIGLATALELHDRGAAVTVIERRSAASGASIAAAGMLAVDDPHNPAAIRGLSQWSVSLYPAFLRRIEDLSGVAIPFQTQRTIQYLSNGSAKALAEHSLDPRELAGALLAAVRSTSIRVLEDTRVASERRMAGGFDLLTSAGEVISTKKIVYAAGAWTTEAMTDVPGGGVPMSPRKGQMLRVRIPAGVSIAEVHRSEGIYVVPRTSGPQAGTALIGATVEDAGFDTKLRVEALAALRALAAGIVAELGDEVEAPQVEAWAGLRPATPDLLPVLGEIGEEGRFVASGHYRNGVLLAPATARSIADMVEGKTPEIDLSAFDPERFCGLGMAPNKNADIRPNVGDNRSFPL